MSQGSASPRHKAATSSDTELNLEYAASIILRVFQIYDVDNGGTLQRRELRQLLRQCGATLSSRQCDEIIDQLDTDGDGEMNFAEFMSFLGRLYQLQFFGTDPGNFWKTAPKPETKHLNAAGRGHPPPLPDRSKQIHKHVTNPVARPLPIPPNQRSSNSQMPGARFQR